MNPVSEKDPGTIQDRSDIAEVMRSKDPRLNIIGAVLTAAAVLLAIPGPAHADVKSVSNTAQGGSGSADLRFGAVAQPFTTGSDADGCTIRIVNVQLDTAPGSGQLTLQLWNSDSVSNNPGTPQQVTFTYQNQLIYGGIQSIGGGLQRFQVPGDDIVLAPNTTYFIVMIYGGSAASAPTWSRTASDDEDSDGRLPGWSIGDQYLQYGSSGWADASVADTTFAAELQIYESVNAFPTASSSTVSTDEDTTLTFDADDFNFSDADDGLLAVLGSEFKTLDHVKIVSLPDADKGTLSLDGVAITSTSWENPVEVTKVQLDEDKLTYRPPLDANGDGLAVFYFRVNDGADDSLFSDTMTIDVTAVNDPPSVSGPAAIEYPDDGTVAVATYTATDPDGDAITWSLSGADSSAFNISAPGVLSFSSAPDFEDPADANDNNVYEVTVEASDGGSTNGTRDVTVTVTKTAVSGLTAIEYEENGVAAVATYTVAGSVGTITWSLSGADSSAFSISNGVLSFSSSPDYEAPADANGNNVYVVTVEASDGGSTVGTRDVTVRVTNGNDAPATMDDTATTNASRAVVVRVLDNDVDVDGDILTVTVPQLGQPGRPTYGTVVPSDGATTTTYRLRDANASHIGDDTFTYTVSDGTATATGMVTVTENADLATLSISDVTLNEPFTPCLHLLFSWPRTNEAQTPAHRSPG